MVFAEISIRSELSFDEFSKLLAIVENYSKRVSHGSLRTDPNKELSGLAIVEIKPIVMDRVKGIAGALAAYRYSCTLVFYPEILDSDTKLEITRLLQLA